MDILDRFFLRYRVCPGYSLVTTQGNIIGCIWFYANDINLFVDDFTCVTIYDNGDAKCDDDMANLLNYTSQNDELLEKCIKLWNSHVRAVGKNELFIKYPNKLYVC